MAKNYMDINWSINQLITNAYHTEVSSTFSSSASLYDIKYNHVALITQSARGSSAAHSGRRGWRFESIKCFPVSNIHDALTPFNKERLGRR